MREVVGCVSHGYRGIPTANTSSEYYCPTGRKISQTRSQTNREISFDQVQLLPILYIVYYIVLTCSDSYPVPP